MTVRFDWPPGLLTGVEEVDEQHREIFRRANALFEACVKGKGAEEAKTLLVFMQGLVVEHFAAEERLQEVIRYPNRSAHRESHQFLLRSLSELSGLLAEEGAGEELVIQLNRWLVGLLVNHIAGEDHVFAAFVRAAPGR
ncbi:MAG: hemerythrin family protein [Deltaproteobacteria bacterium]|nr:hemerythrin family protein [Deltaproteobacteria bacterium]